MKRFALAIALACVLSVSALAGETHTPPGETNGPPGTTQTPPGDVHTGSDAPAPGDMSTSDVAVQTLLTILDLVF